MRLLQAIALCSLVVLGLAFLPDEYQNDYMGELNVECPSGYGLASVESTYTTGTTGKRNVQADRLWIWECVKIDIWKPLFCEWMEQVNTAGVPMFFQCPSDAFMAGVRSVYSSTFYDRVWDVKCCRILTVCMQHCELSGVIAEYREDGNFTARAEDEDGVFVGFFGDYDNGLEDREYRLGYCQFDNCFYPKKYHG